MFLYLNIGVFLSGYDMFIFLEIFVSLSLHMCFSVLIYVFPCLYMFLCLCLYCVCMNGTVLHEIFVDSQSTSYEFKSKIWSNRSFCLGDILLFCNLVWFWAEHLFFWFCEIYTFSNLLKLMNITVFLISRQSKKWSYYLASKILAK